MSKIKNAIKSVDTTLDNANEIKEILQLLYELSDEKATTFQNTISEDLRTAGTIENPTVPISYKLASLKEIRITTSETPSEFISEIGESLKSIITGTSDGVINGISSLINTGLKTILGAGEGEERLRKEYYIATEGLSIVRLDVMMWSRSITATSITKYAEDSIVCVVEKSSVDLSKVDFNSFLSAYNIQLLKSNLEEQNILEEIENAKKVYKELTDFSNTVLYKNRTIKYSENVLSETTSNVSKQWPC